MNFTNIGLFFSNLTFEYSFRENVEKYEYIHGQILYEECYLKCINMSMHLPHPHEFNENLVQYMNEIMKEADFSNFTSLNEPGDGKGFGKIFTLPTPLNYRFWVLQKYTK